MTDLDKKQLVDLHDRIYNTGLVLNNLSEPDLIEGYKINNRKLVEVLQRMHYHHLDIVRQIMYLHEIIQTLD